VYAGRSDVSHADVGLYRCEGIVGDRDMR